MPSPTLDPGARQTAAGKNPAPSPAQGQNPPSPKQTIDPKLGSGQGADPSQPSDPKQPNNAAGSSENPGPGKDPSLQNDPKQPSNVLGDNGDPAAGTDPSLLNYPKQPTGDNGEVDPASSPSTPTIAPETTMIVGDHAVVAGTSGIEVDGVEIKPQGPPATISGVVAINQGSSVVIAHQIIPLTTPTASATKISGHAITPLADGVIVDGTVVTPGAIAVAVSSTSVSVDSSNHVYLAGTPYLLPTANAAPSTTLPNGAVAVPLINAVSIYGTTFTAGAPAVYVSGIAISLDPSYNLIWGGTAQALPFPSPLPLIKGQVTTIDGQVVHPLTDGIAIAGTTLTADAPPITVSGTRISLGASALAIGTSTIPIALNSLPQTTGSVTTVAGKVVQLLSNGISVAGTMLTPGAPPITVSGTMISLGSSALVVGSSTVLLPAENPAPFITTVAGEAITAAPNAVEVAGSTLSPGAPGVTVGGTVVSLDPAGELVVGSKTIALEGPSGGGLGGLIMGGFGSGGPFSAPESPSLAGSNKTLGAENGTTLGVQEFQGSARDLKSSISGRLLAVVMVTTAVLGMVYPTKFLLVQG